MQRNDVTTIEVLRITKPLFKKSRKIFERKTRLDYSLNSISEEAINPYKILNDVEEKKKSNIKQLHENLIGENFLKMQ